MLLSSTVGASKRVRRWTVTGEHGWPWSCGCVPRKAANVDDFLRPWHFRNQLVVLLLPQNLWVWVQTLGPEGTTVALTMTDWFDGSFSALTTSFFCHIQFWFRPICNIQFAKLEGSFTRRKEMLQSGQLGSKRPCCMEVSMEVFHNFWERGFLSLTEAGSLYVIMLTPQRDFESTAARSPDAVSLIIWLVVSDMLSFSTCLGWWSQWTRYFFRVGTTRRTRNFSLPGAKPSEDSSDGLHHHGAESSQVWLGLRNPTWMIHTPPEFSIKSLQRPVTRWPSCCCSPAPPAHRSVQRPSMCSGRCWSVRGYPRRRWGIHVTQWKQLQHDAHKRGTSGGWWDFWPFSATANVSWFQNWRRVPGCSIRRPSYPTNWTLRRGAWGLRQCPRVPKEPFRSRPEKSSSGFTESSSKISKFTVGFCWMVKYWLGKSNRPMVGFLPTVFLVMLSHGFVGAA